MLFFTDLTRNPYYTQIALLNIFICACGLLILWEAWTHGEFWVVTTTLDIPLLGLIVISFLTWMISFVEHPALIKPIYSEGSKAAIFLIVNTYLVYVLAMRYQDRILFKHLLWVTYVVSVIASVYGLAQYFGLEWIWSHTLNPYGSRPVSTFGNPNFMSSFLVIVIPVMMADFMMKITGVPRALLFAGLVATIGALIATLTRSSWMGLLVGMGVLAAGGYSMPEFQNRLRKQGLIVVMILVVWVACWPKGGGGSYSASVVDRITEVKDFSSGTYAPVSQRLLIWLSAWSMVEDHPIVGKGWGCFELFYPFYQGSYLLSKTYRAFRTHANNCHDEILEYWSQTGTIGLGMIIFLWVVFFRLAYSMAQRLPPDWRAIHWGLVGGIAGMLTDSLLNVSIHFAVPAFLFWWWVGSVFALSPETKKIRRLEVNGPRGRAVILLCAAILFCFIVRAGCMWAGEVEFFEGFKLSKIGTDLPAARRHLENAYLWHHLEVNNDYELANVEARLGLQEQALAMYQRALDANAGYDEIYFNRATTYMQRGQSDKAMADYRTCLAINPLSHEAYNALATLYVKDLTRYMNPAEALYNQGVDIFPEDKDMWNNLGYLYTQENKWDEAYLAYRKAVELDPEFELAQKNLRVVAVHAKGHENDPALRLNETYQELNGLMQATRWDAALQKAVPLVEAFPRSFKAHFYLGNILFSLNQFDKAAGEFEQALRLHGDSAPAWQNLGITFERMGKMDDARQAYQRVLQLDPNNAAVKAKLSGASAR